MGKCYELTMSIPKDIEIDYTNETVKVHRWDKVEARYFKPDETLCVYIDRYSREYVLVDCSTGLEFTRSKNMSSIDKWYADNFRYPYYLRKSKYYLKLEKEVCLYVGYKEGIIR